MKFFLSFFLGLSVTLTSFAQSFHYDTVPDPNKKPLFYYETPVKQTNQSQQIENKIPSEKSKFDKNKLVLGGSLGLNFSNYYTLINIAPQIGYALSSKFTAGAGISYNYYHYNDYDESYHYMGFNLFGRLNPIRYISLQVQPEIYRMWGSINDQSIKSRVIPCFLVGAGVNIPAGRGGISTMFFYDVVQNNDSPYGNQVFYSIGYVFGF